VDHLSAIDDALAATRLPDDRAGRPFEGPGCRAADPTGALVCVIVHRVAAQTDPELAIERKRIVR
jgi:hypothetical protein